MIKVVTVEKIYNGHISLRDYIVDNAIKNNDSILVKCKGEEKLLTPKELSENKIVLTDKILHSKFKHSNTYKLYDYEWKPKKQIEHNSTFEFTRLLDRFF